MAMLTRQSWPIAQETLLRELEALEAISRRWRERFADKEYVESLDTDVTDMERAETFEQFVNEMKLCASKAAVLVEVVS